MTAPVTLAGPSGGVLGSRRDNSWTKDELARYGGMARAVVTLGRQPRVGHDRARWASVDWRDYRARVGIGGQAGPWRVRMAEEKAGEPAQWVTEAEGLPFEPGWYTTLIHEERGLVMSDVPGEVAGALPFLDAAKAYGEREGSISVLVTGLGLGIVPAWLLRNTRLRRVDVVEIDADVIELVARDPAARDEWAADPRLHVHHADALTWPARGNGCALHRRCMEPPCWDAAFHDIFDTVAAANLPVMHRLHRRYGRWTRWQMSWERAECEAKRKRGQRTYCLASEDGYGGDR